MWKGSKRNLGWMYSGTGGFGYWEEQRAVPTSSILFDPFGLPKRGRVPAAQQPRTGLAGTMHP